MAFKELIWKVFGSRLKQFFTCILFFAFALPFGFFFGFALGLPLSFCSGRCWWRHLPHPSLAIPLRCISFSKLPCPILTWLAFQRKPLVYFLWMCKRTHPRTNVTFVWITSGPRCWCWSRWLASAPKSQKSCDRHCQWCWSHTIKPPQDSASFHRTRVPLSQEEHLHTWCQQP